MASNACWTVKSCRKVATSFRATSRTGCSKGSRSVMSSLFSPIQVPLAGFVEGIAEALRLCLVTARNLIRQVTPNHIGVLKIADRHVVNLRAWQVLRKIPFGAVDEAEAFYLFIVMFGFLRQ